MSAYFLRRLLLLIPTFLGITMLVFTVTRFVPGGPIEQMLMKMQMGGAEGTGGSGDVSSSVEIPPAVARRRFANDLHELGVRDARASGLYGRVEPLRMSDSQHAACGFGLGGEAARRRQVRRDWLLDQEYLLRSRAMYAKRCDELKHLGILPRRRGRPLMYVGPEAPEMKRQRAREAAARYRLNKISQLEESKG